MTHPGATPTGGRLVFVGDVFCDLIFTGVGLPQPGQEVYADRFAIAPGGVANRAVAAARLGADTAIVSTIGDDPLGVHLLRRLEDEEHLDLSRMPTVHGYQTPVSVSISGSDDRSFITYQEPPKSTDNTGGLEDAYALDVDVMNAGMPWIRALRETGTLVFGGVGWDPTEQWSASMLDALSTVDVLVLNDVEATSYAHAPDVEAAARILSTHVGLVVITCGADGAVALESGDHQLTTARAPRVRTVDTTGAGDVFTAAFMTALAQGLTLSEQLGFAAACASYSVGGLGGSTSAPHTADVAAFTNDMNPPSIRDKSLHADDASR